MTAAGRAKVFIGLRRIVQAACLILFLYLVLTTRFKDSGPPHDSVRVFFFIDPLILAGTWLAAHAVPAAALLALITVAVTLIFGRVFCGWVCPFGTVHHVGSWLRTRFRKLRLKDGAFSKWQHGKYLLLVALLAMALFGAHWIGVFDPISFLYRSTATAVLPAAQYAVEAGSTAVYQADPHLGPVHATSVTEPIYKASRKYLFLTERPAFWGSTAILALFLLVFGLNFVRPRFWCRYICPLGAMLGFFAKRPFLRLKNTDQECTRCNRCARICPAAAQPEKPGEWLPTECFVCWNCVAECRNGAIDFGFGSPLRKPTKARLDLSKRALLASGIGGLAGLALFRLTPRAQAKTFNPALIRPPGAHEEPEFLQRCLQCGLCMKVCPTNALHPATFEAGLEGLWTPVLIPRVGYCEYECNLCGQVCPTEAIKPLRLDEKKEVKIGLATFDTTRCLPYAYGRNCIVCEEHCPVPTKAIYFVEKEVVQRDGTTQVLKQPRVAPDLCIGCGICENVCVFKDRPAVRVTSANETRHPNNQPILPALPGFASDAPYGADIYE